MDCNGQFSITGWDENILSEKREGVKQTHASITQAYEGSMAGQSDVEFLMSYQTSMLALFVGFESFVGVIDGRRGTISFKHDGKFVNGIASSNFSSIEGSATGELSNCNILGTFESAEGGKANYTINLTE